MSSSINNIGPQYTFFCTYLLKTQDISSLGCSQHKKKETAVGISMYSDVDKN